MKDVPRGCRCGLAVSVVLAFSFVVYWVFFQWVSPLPFYHHPDPQMAYLLDSLSPFKGHGYRYLDHPNVTVNLIGSLIYLITYPLTIGSSDSFIVYHLRDPDIFLAMGRFVLAFLHAGAVLLVARLIAGKASWPESLGGAALAVLYFVLHSRAIRNSQIWTQDSFFFLFGTTFLLFVFLFMKDSNRPFHRRHMVLLGAGCGVLLATHLLFSTYVVGIGLAVVLYDRLIGLGVRRTGKDVLAFGASMLGSFLLLLLPAAGEIQRSVEWWWELVSTRGNYGGQGSIQPLEQFRDNLSVLTHVQELVLGAGFIALIVCVGLFAMRREWSRHPGTTALALGLLVQLAVSFVLLLVVKSDINMRYFLVVASMLPILLAIGLTLLSRFRRASAMIHVGLALVVLPLFLSNVSHEIAVQDRAARGFAEMTALRAAALSAYATSIGRSPESLRIIWGQGGAYLWSPGAALWYGDGHVSSTGESHGPRPSFSKEIAALYPNQRVLFQHRHIHHPDIGWLDSDRIAEEDDIDLEWDIALVRNLTIARIPLFADAMIYQDKQQGVVFVLPR